MKENVAGVREHSRTGIGWRWWAPPALLTLLSCLFLIRRPVLWIDELATWSAADRSLPELLRFTTGHQDAVQAFYYALMHVWTGIAGLTPVTLRAPSVAAMTVSAALVTVIGGHLFGRVAGLTSGLLFAVVPGVTLYGQEARPYGLMVMCAAAGTLALVLLLERAERGVSGRWHWAGYVVAMTLVGWLQLTSDLILGAHLLAVASFWWRTRDTGFAVRWAAAAAGVLALLLPLAVVAAGQTGQIAWIAGPEWRRILLLPLDVFASPQVGGLVAGLALLGALRLGRGGVLAVGLVLVPYLGLTAASVETSFLLPRYLMVTLLGWCLLAGAVVARAGRHEVALAVVVVLLVGLPAHFQLHQVGRNHPGDTDLRRMAAIVAATQHPGDAVVVPQDRGWRLRVGLQAYLPPGPHPDDVLVTGGTDVTHTFDSAECDPAECLGTPPRVWLACLDTCTDPLRSPGRSGVSAATSELLQAKGYRKQRTWKVAHGTLGVYALPRIGA